MNVRGWSMGLVAPLVLGACGLSLTPTPLETDAATPTPLETDAATTTPLETDFTFGPRTSPSVACAPDDLAAPIPTIELVTPDGAHHPGQPYASTWAGSAVGPAGGDIPKTPAGGGAGQPIEIVIGGDVCADNWYIAYSAMPPGGPAPWKFMPIAELVPTVARNRDPDYASQNRFTLAPLPPGDWLLGVELGFLGGLELVWFRVSAA